MKVVPLGPLTCSAVELFTPRKVLASAAPTESTCALNVNAWFDTAPESDEARKLPTDADTVCPTSTPTWKLPVNDPSRRAVLPNFVWVEMRVTSLISVWTSASRLARSDVELVLFTD